MMDCNKALARRFAKSWVCSIAALILSIAALLAPWTWSTREPQPPFQPAQSSPAAYFTEHQDGIRYDARLITAGYAMPDDSGRERRGSHSHLQAKATWRLVDATGTTPGGTESQHHPSEHEDMPIPDLPSVPGSDDAPSPAESEEEEQTPLAPVRLMEVEDVRRRVMNHRQEPSRYAPGSALVVDSEIPSPGITDFVDDETREKIRSAAWRTLAHGESIETTIPRRQRGGENAWPQKTTTGEHLAGVTDIILRPVASGSLRPPSARGASLSVRLRPTQPAAPAAPAHPLRPRRIARPVPVQQIQPAPPLPNLTEKVTETLAGTAVRQPAPRARDWDTRSALEPLTPLAPVASLATLAPVALVEAFAPLQPMEPAAPVQPVQSMPQLRPLEWPDQPVD